MDSTPAPRNVSRPFDPKRNTQFKVRLGNVRAADEGKAFKAVAFNHKPSQTGSKRITSVKRTKASEDAYELYLDEETSGEHRRYAYAGRRRDLEHNYVLTFDYEQQTVQLDNLSSIYEFNMVSAPWEKDMQVLKRSYAQIEPDMAIGASYEKHTSGSEDENRVLAPDGADDNNPFDYRHYLSGIPGVQPEQKGASLASTPLLGPRSGSVSPRPPLSGNLGRSPQIRATAPLRKQPRSTAAKKPVPPKASQHTAMSNTSEDDNDGLRIIDNAPATPSRTPNRKRVGIAGGSRSLHAVAEAAVSSRHDTRAERDTGSGYEEEDESDEPSNIAASSAPVAPTTAKSTRQADDDIEDLKLPGPAKSRPPMQRRQSMWESGDEEELEAALAADDDDQPDAKLPNADPSKTSAIESESESEEE